MSETLDTSKMNVYQKLQQCRVELQKMGLQKSGENTFSKYTYYELQDFLPAINELCEKYQLCTHTTFDNEFATLHVVNSEKPDEVITFTSPQAEASLKGCYPIQNVGAVETYQRRYLLMMAFEIVEVEKLEPTTGNKNKIAQTPKTKTELEEILAQVDEIAKEKAKTNKNGVTETIKSIHSSANYNTIKNIETAKKVLEALNTL